MLVAIAKGQQLYFRPEDRGRNIPSDQLEAWESVDGPVGEDGYPKPLWPASRYRTGPRYLSYHVRLSLIKAVRGTS